KAPSVAVTWGWGSCGLMVDLGNNAVLHQQGDLDTHGFTILYRARSYIPEWQPVQIDEDILLGHKPPRMGAESPPVP
ncbi:Wadjet anti-phage system protein JetD domain-containing protein, partial [Aeromonas allosaccharophila]|uniref:Wadjet anti-phage system protein JetD domain-containing protein n=1 Tax=Aeromonas allosaccharophila TaxID=656 RepID=UPI002B4630BE